MKRLFKKLGFLNNKEKEKEIKKYINSEAKEKHNSEKLNGIEFNSEEKENAIKGCSFEKEKL